MNYNPEFVLQVCGNWKWVITSFERFPLLPFADLTTLFGSFTFITTNWLRSRLNRSWYSKNSPCWICQVYPLPFTLICRLCVRTYALILRTDAGLSNMAKSFAQDMALPVRHRWFFSRWHSFFLLEKWFSCRWCCHKTDITQSQNLADAGIDFSTGEMLFAFLETITMAWESKARHNFYHVRSQAPLSGTFWEIFRRLFRA